MATRPCLILLAACLAGSLPAAAQADTTLAGNPAGDEVLLLQPLQQQSRHLYAATRTRTGGFGPLKPIAPPPGIFDAQAAVDNAGGAVAAWRSHDPQPAVRNDRGFASVRAPGAAFGPPTQLFEDPPNRSMALAANGAGDAIVGWSATTPTATYAFRRAGESSWKLGTLSIGDLYLQRFSVDRDGTAHAFAWDSHNDGSSDLHESTRPRDGDFGPFALVAQLPRSNDVVLAASRSGRVLILWTDDTGIKAIERAPGGSFGAPFRVPTGPFTPSIESPPYVRSAAVAPSGAAVVAIRVGGVVTDVAARKPGGKFVLSRVRGADPRVAVNDAGDAAVVWTTLSRAVHGLYRPSTKPRFGRSIRLAAPRPFALVFPVPSLAISNSGRATAAWEQSDGATISVIARDFRSRAGRREVVGRLPSFVREGPPDACRPVGARVVRSNARSTVFVSRDLFGCLLDRGVPVRLDNFAWRAEPPSTMSLAGALVAYGLSYGASAAPAFKVVDLRDPETGVNLQAELDGAHKAFLAVSRLKSNGASAWIACKRLGKGRESRSRCRRKGGMTKDVFVWSRSAFAPRLADSGHTIDPSTFKLRGSKLTWRHGKKLRRATLR